MQTLQMLSVSLANDLANRGVLRPDCFDLAVYVIRAHFSPVLNEFAMEKAEREVEHREIAELHGKLASIAQMAGVTS